MDHSERLRELLESTAADSPQPPAVAGFMTEAAGRRRRRLALAAMGVVACVTGVAFGGTAIVRAISSSEPPQRPPAAASSASPSPSRKEDAGLYPLLAESDSIRVYAPARGQPWGWCPSEAQQLSADDVAEAKRAAFIGIDVLYARTKPPLSTEGATAWGGLARKSKTEGTLAKTECGGKARARTIFIVIDLPQVAEFSASLSRPVFYLSRYDKGWIMWHQPH